MSRQFSIFTFLLFSLLGLSSYSQEKQENHFIDAIILKCKNYDFDEALKFSNSIQSTLLKNLFLSSLRYQQNGIVSSTDSLEYSSLNERYEYIGRYLFAEALEREESGKDSLIYKLYLKSLQESISKNDTLVINEIYKRLNLHLFKNSNELKVFKKHIDQSESYVKDSVDKFHLYYYKIGYEMLKSQKNKKIDTTVFLDYYDRAEKLANRPYLKGYISQFKSVFLGGALYEIEEADYYNRKAITYYEKESFYMAKRSSASVRFNRAVDFFHLKRYEKAIPIFKNDIKSQKNQLYLMYGYDWLYKSYDELKEHDSAYFYFKKMVDTKNKLDRLKHARDIKRIDGEYDLSMKEQELASLAKDKTTLQNSLLTLIPFLGIATIVLIVVFFLYKRYKVRNTTLEEERFETLQKLDELKKLVIKNHIVLKDKTKVYITDLMYIKADDHYLKLFLSNGKNHLVRGRLKKLKEELPPNFVQCHRSYVVNANFIKQKNSTSLLMINQESIPLSRSFKSKL